GQTGSREELATLLWGETPEAQARQSLRQALAGLRKDLDGDEWLDITQETVRLRPGLWSVDALEFESLARSDSADDLDRAALLFGGEILQDCAGDEEGFGDWLLTQRERTQRVAARLCERFSAEPRLVKDPQQALGAVERLLTLDPLREDWQRFALILHARYRGHNEALAQAEAFARLLKRELDVEP